MAAPFTAPLHLCSSLWWLVCILPGFTTGSDSRLFSVGKLGLGIISTVDVQV